MSLTIQFYTMLSMVGMGAWVGAALDTYQRFLKRPRRNRWIVFVHDIVFWAVQAMFVFYVLLLVNEAELRFYVFVALVCGFAAYQSLLKTLYMAVLEAIIRTVVRTYRLLEMLVKILIIRPIVYLFQFLFTCILLLLQLLRTTSLLLYRLIVQLLLLIWKIILAPLRLIGVIVWKLLPNRVKIFVKKYAGILKKIQKVKGIVLKWWEYIKRWLGGPRK
ncbi:spore cortex biosynthesis protein YabQ [Ectobacillus funiculus]|uniref:Spore cortex biosynthesis protein YabQ n=1 Tax=Ectobacillus funiculus TaxID=137993 RepID=A0ABV5WDT3_9BACI